MNYRRPARGPRLVIALVLVVITVLSATNPDAWSHLPGGVHFGVRTGSEVVGMALALAIGMCIHWALRFLFWLCALGEIPKDARAE